MMCASRSSAGWLKVVAVSLIGFGLAELQQQLRPLCRILWCGQPSPHGDATGSIPQNSNHVETHPLPHLRQFAGRLVGRRSWHGFLPARRGRHRLGSGTAASAGLHLGRRHARSSLRRAKRSRSLSRRYGVPVAAIMDANSITNPATVRPGQHLVIPRRRGPASALAAPDTRMGANAPLMPAAPVGPPRTALVPAGASTSWRRARRCTASRASTASRSWFSPGPTVFRPARCCGSATASPFRVAERRSRRHRRPPCQWPLLAPRGEGNVGAVASARLAPRRAACRAGCARGSGKRGQIRRGCRQPAVIPLAGARPGHRRLWSEAQRPAERRHQSRRARGHPGQGGGRRRGRLCRQRAQGLRQSRAGAPQQRLRHRLRPRQRNHGQARRHGQARTGDRQVRPDRQRHLAATAFRDPQRLDPGRSFAVSQRRR